MRERKDTNMINDARKEMLLLCHSFTQRCSARLHFWRSLWLSPPPPSRAKQNHQINSAKDYNDDKPQKMKRDKTNKGWLGREEYKDGDANLSCWHWEMATSKLLQGSIGVGGMTRRSILRSKTPPPSLCPHNNTAQHCAIYSQNATLKSKIAKTYAFWDFQ
jgi:hypothetical protein